MRARARPAGMRLVGLDHQRVAQGGLGDLPLARGAAHAVLGKCLLEVGGVAQLAVAGLVVVGAGHDPDAVLVGVVGEGREDRDDRLAVPT